MRSASAIEWLPMQSPVGRSLGPYQIIEQVGAGGMAEVFKARDGRLGRVVALKVAKERFSDRVQNEARATAALNHPHIAALYDVGPDYLVMEYVEGQPLRGPLPAPQALRYAKELLEALEAAHRRGIIHRDLKPANILVTKAGVKVLDFGLAQVVQPLTLGEDTPTVEMPTAGTIGGTPQYMAPEQLQGKPADARSDIFAFGLVLYEMLGGAPAFEADDSASLITAIMASQPAPLKTQVPDVPPALERIVEACIAKDPDERWQSAGDIRRALELIDPTLVTPPHQARPQFRWWYAVVPAIVLGVAVLGSVILIRGNRREEPWRFRPLTYSGRASNPALSPDGKQVAFAWTADNANTVDLHIQLVSGGNPLRLKDTRPRGRPAWSPDGAEIAFQRADGLYVIPALGGAQRRIAAFSGLRNNNGNVAWAPSGSFLIVDGRGAGLMTVSRDGGEPRPLTKPGDANDSSPAIAPDSRAVAFVRFTSSFNATLMVLPLTESGAEAGDATATTHAASSIEGVSWTRDGSEILFENAPGGGSAAIWRIARSGGRPVRVNVPSMLAGDPTTARATARMVFVSGYNETNIGKLPLAEGKPGGPQTIVEALGDHRDLSVSADGARIAFVSTRTGSKEVWIASADGSDQTQLTFFEGASVGSPRWSPDGASIAFDGYVSGSSDIYVVPAQGGKPVRLTSDPGNEIRPSWSHDGKSIYFGWNRGGTQQIWRIPSAGGDPVQVTRQRGQEAFETTDGGWVYVAAGTKLYRVRPDGSDEAEVRSGFYGGLINVGQRHVYIFDPRPGQLLRAPFGATAFQPVYTFSDADRPTCGFGSCIGLPRDESYVIYRRVTRSMSSLTLIDNFR
jgi:eukaryotic-like serine/threonine-protein kinase